jgi:RimJ/RimL family protein N-acetyltransferase
MRLDALNGIERAKSTKEMTRPMTASAPDRRSLIGHTVRLDAMVAADAAGLFAALNDPRVYAAGFGGGPAGRPATAAAMTRWVTGSIDDGRRAAAYTVRLVRDGPLGSAGTIIGTSSLGDLSLPDERIHLGWTAYTPGVWATAVNPECKLLLLEHCFDDCGLGRVKIQTDNLNVRSQGAIARLGAVREGVLRRHQHRADGSFRDTVVFSILRDEWPAVRAALLERLGLPR